MQNTLRTLEFLRISQAHPTLRNTVCSYTHTHKNMLFLCAAQGKNRESRLRLNIVINEIFIKTTRDLPVESLLHDIACALYADGAVCSMGTLLSHHLCSISKAVSRKSTATLSPSPGGFHANIIQEQWHAGGI